MWEHKDGKGFDLTFEIRVAEERLVARVVDNKADHTKAHEAFKERQAGSALHVMLYWECLAKNP